MVDNKTVTSSTPAFRLRWDVFLSFRGEDTRDGFTDRLYNGLERQGVRVFRDNDGLTQGDEIAQSLLDAIEDSAAAIAIISPRYANSRWCLEELAKICECERLILPVFYLVDPSNPPKHWKAEYAKSARSSCKSCKNTIDKGNLKLGKMVHATQFDGFMHMRNHAGCILKKATQFHV